VSQVFTEDSSNLKNLVRSSKLIVVASPIQADPSGQESINVSVSNNKVSAALKSGTKIINLTADPKNNQNLKDYSHLVRSFKNYNVHEVLKGSYGKKKELAVNSHGWESYIKDTLRYYFEGIDSSPNVKRYKSKTQESVDERNKRVLFLVEDNLVVGTYQETVSQGFESTSKTDEIKKILAEQ